MNAEVDLTQPLPTEVTGRATSGLLAYRRWPAYSAGWARGRARTIGALVTVIVVALFGLALLSVPPPRPWGASLQTGLGLLVPLFAGPWLASWARRRVRSPRAAVAAVAAALAGLLLAMAAFHEWAAEPLKQQVAEWTGDVDEHGQRRRVALAIGVFVRNLEQPLENDLDRTPDPTQQPLGRGTTLSTHLTLLVAGFFLAGGLALTRPLRERDALRTLAAERALAEAQRRRHEAELQLSVLAAQVEPHFLFNTLAGVRSAIAVDPARASELIDRLSTYLRASIPRLRDGGAGSATLGAQVELVRAYLALMSARMPRLRWRIEVPEPLLALPFPPLMLISLAENAVKHGVEPKVGPAEVVVHAARQVDGRLVVTVADDGAGFGDGSGSGGGGGLGLTNIRERLRQMHGDRATLQLRARAGGGVEAELVLPVE